MAFWKKWTSDQRTAARKVLGLLVAAFTVFAILSSVSYLFHWREDMSLIGSAGIPDSSQVGNAGGSLGLTLGSFLVGDCFGFGSFALFVILAAIAVRLLTDKWKFPMVRTIVIALSTAVVASLILSFIGKCAGLQNLFGGGLGGRCGAYLIDTLSGLMGMVVTGMLIVIFALSLAFLCSNRFTAWFTSLFEVSERPERNPEPATANLRARKSDPATEAEPTTEPDPEPIIRPRKPVDENPAKPEVRQPKPERPVKTDDGTVGSAAEGAEGKFEIIDGDGLDTDVVEELKPIDNRLDPPDGLPRYKFPSLELLDAHSTGRRDVTTEELNRNNNKIRAVLGNYKIQVVDVKAVVGPTVTLYKVYPAPGVKIADIKKLQEDIAISLGAKGVRVVTLADSVGIEVANDYSSIVPLRALLNDPVFRESKADLPVAIGYTITQKVKVFDLADAPHLLVAGATKQGKSVGLNVIVSSLLYSKHPSELKFVFIDPKMVEFSSYSHLLKHYLAVLPDAENEAEEKNNAIIKTPKNAEKALRSLCTEMDERYELLSQAGVNNIKLYNAKYKERHLNPKNGHRYLPYLVVVVDEYADLTMMTGASPEARAASRSITNSIIRLAQKGRAAGLHVILATQRPSVDVISGIIKSNFPMRIAFRVASRVDSQTILDAPGAEKLIGKGDMLFSAGIDTERIQCGYVSGEEIDRITDFIQDQTGYGKSYNTPYYLPSAVEQGAEGGGGMIDMSDLDDRFIEAARMVVTSQRGSTSDLQRKLGMGYAKAGRVMDQLEAAGVVGPQEGSKPRQVLIPDLNTLEETLKHFMK